MSHTAYHELCHKNTYSCISSWAVSTNPATSAHETLNFSRSFPRNVVYPLLLPIVLSSIPTLIFLPALWQNARNTTEKTRICVSAEPLKSLGKKGTHDKRVPAPGTHACTRLHRHQEGSLDERNSAIVSIDSPARVITAIQITSVRWRPYLLPKHRNWSSQALRWLCCYSSRTIEVHSCNIRSMWNCEMACES